MSAYLERHRDEYYALLLAVSECGAWSDWIAFFMRGVSQQAVDTAHRMARLQDLQDEWHQRLSQARSSALTLRLSDELFLSPLLTIPRARDVLGVTYRGAQGIVQKLVQAGIMQPTQSTTYGRWFVAEEILRIVEA